MNNNDTIIKDTVIDKIPFFANEQMIKKYNALVRFKNRVKDLYYENGCYSEPIESVVYINDNNFDSYKRIEQIEIHGVKYSHTFTLENLKDIKIDRKYKMIELYNYVKFK